MARPRWRTALAAVAAACVALLGLLAVACGPVGRPSADDAPSDSGSGAAAAPRRLVSLSPNVTEILFRLGVGDRVVGVDDYSDHPPEAREKPRLGGYLDPDLERLVSLAPDLVILLAAQGGLAAKLEALGLDVLQVDNQDLADVAASMRTLGEAVGEPRRGRELARAFEAALAPRELPAPPGRVMVVAGRAPGSPGEMLVAGPDSYPYELVSRLGADNVFSDLGSRYATVGAEEVVARAPATVVELRADRLDDAAKRALAADWRDLLGGGVRVVVVDGPEVLIPGPRLPEVYDRLAAGLTAAETP
jgi:iron complex transport system substrate-binding protein